MRILAVEDEVNLQKLLQVHFSREGWNAVFCDSGEKALDLWASTSSKQSFDIAVLDWMIPGKLNGLDLCKKFAGKLPTLMLTARSTSVDIVMALESGADDYLTKPFDGPVLVARIRALMRRASLRAEPPSQHYVLGDLEVFPERFEAKLLGKSVELTASEFKILVAMIEGRGSVLSRKRLLTKIQEPGVTVVERIVDTHVYAIRKKIGSASDFIETIRGVGYRLQA